MNRYYFDQLVSLKKGIKKDHNYPIYFKDMITNFEKAYGEISNKDTLIWFRKRMNHYKRIEEDIELNIKEHERIELVEAYNNISYGYVFKRKSFYIIHYRNHIYKQHQVLLSKIIPMNEIGKLGLRW